MSLANLKKVLYTITFILVGVITPIFYIFGANQMRESVSLENTTIFEKKDAIDLAVLAGWLSIIRLLFLPVVVIVVYWIFESCCRIKVKEESPNNSPDFSFKNNQKQSDRLLISCIFYTSTICYFLTFILGLKSSMYVLSNLTTTVYDITKIDLQKLRFGALIVFISGMVDLFWLVVIILVQSYVFMVGQ